MDLEGMGGEVWKIELLKRKERENGAGRGLK